MLHRAQTGIFEPICGKLGRAIGHVLATENAQGEELLWRQLRPEVRVKVFPHRLRQTICVSMLHKVVDLDVPLRHRRDVPPSVEGNRRACEMPTEDQAACRRVRLTVRSEAADASLKARRIALMRV